MGQRHQIYVALPGKQGQGVSIVGIHHQWLYGHTAVRMAERFLTFVERARERESKWHPLLSGFNSPLDILRSIYSCDPDNGYYHQVHDLEGELQDPLIGDNNDGITVFDLRGLCDKVIGHSAAGRVSYCFVSLYGHRGLPELIPVSARRYCRAYYPTEVPEIRVRGRIAAQLDDTRNEAEIRVRQFEKLRAPLMTPRALYELWPNSFPVAARETQVRLVLPDLGDHE